MANYVSPINQIYFDTDCYKNCQSITSVDLHNIPFANNTMAYAFNNCQNLKFVNNINPNSVNIHCTFMYCTNLIGISSIPLITVNMYQTFYGCSNLLSVPDIPENVTNMYHTFYGCSKLKKVPNIPNSVTNMVRCFAFCSNLTYVPSIPNGIYDLTQTFTSCYDLLKAPSIPNSVSNMFQTFSSCPSITTAPNIPDNVRCMNSTFYSCTNLTGNIYIKSNQITNAINCFNNTNLAKNVYIPFYYSNNEYTQTYNSFISAGYKTDGSVCGVRLKDINSPPNSWNLTITGIRYPYGLVNVYSDYNTNVYPAICENLIASYNFDEVDVETETHSLVINGNDTVYITQRTDLGFKYTNTVGGTETWIEVPFSVYNSYQYLYNITKQSNDVVFTFYGD